MKTTKGDLLIEIADLNFQNVWAEQRITELEASLKLENEDKAALQLQVGELRQDLQHAHMQRDAKDEQLRRVNRKYLHLEEQHEDLHAVCAELLAANLELHERLEAAGRPVVSRIAKFFTKAA